MITISQTAKNILLDLIKKDNGKAAFLYLKGGGCNGFSYKFKILDKDEKPNKLDEIYKLDTNNNLYLCGSTLMFILNTKIDYKEDIMGSRFDFQNSSISSKCGCGTSFDFL
jgi:iron-sulfur cluster assembly accessory protein